MKVQTTRFGELELDKNDIITFTEGPLGFDHLKKFFIVDPGDKTFILWLQSADDSATAFPILEPRIFKTDYIVKLLPGELNSLALSDLKAASVFSILTIPQNITEMSANLKAPIVINNTTKIGRQIVLQDSKLDVRHPMYNELKTMISKFSQDNGDTSEIKKTEVVDVSRVNQPRINEEL